MFYRLTFSLTFAILCLNSVSSFGQVQTEFKIDLDSITKSKTWPPNNTNWVVKKGQETVTLIVKEGDKSIEGDESESYFITYTNNRNENDTVNFDKKSNVLQFDLSKVLLDTTLFELFKANDTLATITFEWAEVDIKKDSNERNNCLLIDDKEDNYFIPPLLNASYAEEIECTSCTNDYKVVLDLTNSPTLCYYKRVKCDCKEESKNKKGKKNNGDSKINIDNDARCNACGGSTYCLKPVIKIKPKVGSIIGFQTIGFVPFADSIAFSSGFESKNLELREQFATYITPKTGEKKEEEKADSDGKAESTRESSLPFFKKMKKEYKSYYIHIAKTVYDKEMVAVDLIYINQQLSNYCFVMQTYSSSGLMNGVIKYLDSKKITGEEKAQILQVVTEAANYYSKIINYASSKILPVQVQNEDQLTYTFTYFKDKKQVAKGDYYLFTKGGVKIDFSSGFVFNSLVDYDYTIQKGIANTADSLNSKIIKKEKGDYIVGIGLLTHIYFRTGTYYNYGLNTGVIVDANSKLKYLAGVSFMIGYEQRFVISGGAIFGAVKRLDNSYNDALDKYVPTDQLSGISSSVPTVDKWKTGWYVGITYNLGGTTIGKKSDK